MQTDLLMPDGPTRAGVLLLHSWWGQTPGYLSFAAALARHGFAVALPDLFDGRTATTEDEARALRAAPRRQPVYRQLEQALARLRAEAGGANSRIGTVGFSMGGHWAVWLSQRPVYAIRATVLYYAARGGDFSHCTARTLAHFAETDPFVSNSARHGMERAMARAGVAYDAFDYPGTGHWFAEPDHPAYRPDAAGLAFERSQCHLANALL